MTEFEPIEIECIDEDGSGYSDDGLSFTIVAKLSSVPPREWEESFPGHYRQAWEKQTHPGLKPCGDAELLWSSERGSAIKVATTFQEGDMKRCILLIQEAINLANRAYEDLAGQRGKRQTNDSETVAKLNKWIAVQKKGTRTNAHG